MKVAFLNHLKAPCTINCPHSQYLLAGLCTALTSCPALLCLDLRVKALFFLAGMHLSIWLAVVGGKDYIPCHTMLSLVSSICLQRSTPWCSCYDDLAVPCTQECTEYTHCTQIKLYWPLLLQKRHLGVACLGQGRMCVGGCQWGGDISLTSCCQYFL